jgi:hypothetical protein
MKVVVHKRTVKAKQIETIFEALKLQTELEEKFPNSSIEIERTSGGGLHSYRLTIVQPVEIEVPDAPELEPLPFPQYPPRTPHYGSRNRPEFGSWRDWQGDHAKRREVQKANGLVYQANRHKLQVVEDKYITPQFKK